MASNNQGSDVEPGQVDSLGHEDYGWNRGLSPRAVIMLSLGGGIGLGLWIGTGSALSSGELQSALERRSLIKWQRDQLAVLLDMPWSREYCLPFDY